MCGAIRPLPPWKTTQKGPTNIRICSDPRGWTTCVIPPPIALRWGRQHSAHKDVAALARAR